MDKNPNNIFFKLVSESIYFSNEENQVFFQDDFGDLNPNGTYFVLGDPEAKASTSANANVAFASQFSKFKSKFAANKTEILNQKNSSLNKVNTPLPKTKSFNRSFLLLELDC